MALYVGEGPEREQCHLVNFVKDNFGKIWATLMSLYVETKKYGPNERTDQNSRKRTK